jgi:glycerol-3-phosphate O-acyltransferase
VEFLRDFFRQEFVFLPEEDLAERVRRTLAGMVSRNLVGEIPGGYSVPTGRRQDLLFFARLIQSYFESYYVVGSTLKHISRRRLSQRVFMWRVRLTGHRFLQTRKIQLPESLSQVNYANAMDHLIQQKTILRQVDKAIREEVYLSLNRERRPIHWRRLKKFLRVYG